MKKTLALIFMSGMAVLSQTEMAMATPETITSITPSHERPVIEEAQFEPGVSIEGVQHAICQGQPYGRKSYSSAEREAACQRYAELTGIQPERSSRPSGALIIGALSLLVTSSIAYAIHRHSKTKSQAKRVRSLKGSRK
jgi:hypothetical protein